jgi:hypothetical protein
MSSLAVAQTAVSGTVTLQGIAYSFTASASGTAHGNQVPYAKKSATIASNTAAYSAARIAIDKILAKESAVLSELEITSLISNNFTTTVKVYKHIALASIATSKDGRNYFIRKKTTIWHKQCLIVPNGVNLTINAPFTNYGYVQLGHKGSSGTIVCTSNQPVNNITNWYNASGVIYNLHSGFANNVITTQGVVTSTGKLINDGIFVVRNENNAGGQGYINNNGANTSVTNFGTFTIETNGSIHNNDKSSYILNSPAEDDDPSLVGVFCNNGEVYGVGYIINSGTWLGTGTCDCDGCPVSTGTC